MDIEKKKKAILEATKHYSKRKIDSKGKGKAVLKLQKRIHVSEKKINEMYGHVISLGKSLGSNNKRIPKSPRTDLGIRSDSIGETTALEKENILLKEETERLKQEIIKLKEENAELKEKQAGLGSSLGIKPTKKLGEVKGFSLRMKTVGAKGRTYQKLYATKRIKGKQVWIYIGDGNPEEKIKAWLKKKKQEGKV